ncbi:uncharacterized protein LOC126569719 [Anopheles aquasalis]|uniref:uncharacterized protein LOC126569719 n=1 Tax=Anopheles aquasalis TaxID=42839 RepID=UPI00215A3393|nr:uncharacterized protein LOC126569719 [Anopheles aquasalis]
MAFQLTNLLGEMNTNQEYCCQSEGCPKYQTVCGDYESRPVSDSMENFCSSCGTIYEYSVKNMAKLFQRKAILEEEPNSAQRFQPVQCLSRGTQGMLEATSGDPVASLTEGSVKKLRNLFEAKVKALERSSSDVKLRYRTTSTKGENFDGTDADRSEMMLSPSLPCSVDLPHPEGQMHMYNEQSRSRSATDILHSTIIKELPDGLQINVVLKYGSSRSVSRNTDRTGQNRRAMDLPFQ